MQGNEGTTEHGRIIGGLLTGLIGKKSVPCIAGNVLSYHYMHSVYGGRQGARALYKGKLMGIDI